MGIKSTRLWQRALLLLVSAGLAGWLLSPVGAVWLTPGPVGLTGSEPPNVAEENVAEETVAEGNDAEDLKTDPSGGSLSTSPSETGVLRPRMDGVSLTAPPRPVDAGVFARLKAETAADWVSVIPYAFCFPNDPAVHFDVSRQWWGERSEGVVAQVQFARQQGMKVMIKPHVWVVHGGWIGEYGFEKQEDWERWEKAYQRYILRYARLADSLHADLFCLSTETERAVRERPDFWPNLIKQVRLVYDGPITYAANWDNFQNIPFWEELDYIGIDAYFPLLDNEQMTLDGLLTAWQPHLKQVETVHARTGKPVLFTEYGYLSVPGSTWQTWKLENKLHQLPADEGAQKLAYQALYETFWDKHWFAGGFLWKWYLDQDSRLREHDRDYTPQGKQVLDLIKTRYQ